MEAPAGATASVDLDRRPGGAGDLDRPAIVSNLLVIGVEPVHLEAEMEIDCSPGASDIGAELDPVARLHRQRVAARAW